MRIRSFTNEKPGAFAPGFSVDWWRWGESNPRPKARDLRYYMLSTTFVLGRRQHDVRSTPPDTPALFNDRLTGRRRKLFRDSDPTSTSTDTSGFGAYALSGESVVVVVGNYDFAAGLARKATPSACTSGRCYSRRSQCTPGNVKPLTVESMGTSGAGFKGDMPWAAGVQASLLWRRIVRCFSRAQSRSFEAWRLSWSCLPFASAISSFTLLPFQYIAVGTTV
jgi:hypothetical protein